MKTKWVRTAGGLAVVMTDGFSAAGEKFGGLALVDRRPCGWPRRWPLVVLIDFGKCFRTKSVVRPGHVVKCPASIALIQVDGTGLQHA
jgi:hypothetical protein